MEKSQTKLLQEYQQELESLKGRIAALEEKIATLLGTAYPDEEAVDFTDIQLGINELPEQSTPAEPEVTETEVPFEAEPEPAPAEPEPAPEISAPEVSVLEPEPEPAAEPEPAPAPAPAPAPVSAEPDPTAQLPWRKDKPGMAVKNIRSGISLLDRALFIGTLFKEDFALYDQTIANLNAMSSLDEAVDYIRENFPSWNLKSDVVYHFMMCVRKKLG